MTQTAPLLHRGPETELSGEAGGAQGAIGKGRLPISLALPAHPADRIQQGSKLKAGGLDRGRQPLAVRIRPLLWEWGLSCLAPVTSLPQVCSLLGVSRTAL